MAFDYPRRVALKSLINQPMGPGIDRGRDDSQEMLKRRLAGLPVKTVQSHPRYDTPDRMSQGRHRTSLSLSSPSKKKQKSDITGSPRPSPINPQADLTSPRIVISTVHESQKARSVTKLALTFTKPSTLGRGSQCTHRFPRNSKAISRLHAEVVWSDHETKFTLKVLGQNGLSVDGIGTVSQGTDLVLDSGALQEISGVSLDFFGQKVILLWPAEERECGMKDEVDCSSESGSVEEKIDEHQITHQPLPEHVLVQEWPPKAKRFEGVGENPSEGGLRQLMLQVKEDVETILYHTPTLATLPESSFIETSSVAHRSRSNSFSSIHDTAHDHDSSALSTPVSTSEAVCERLPLPHLGISSELSFCQETRDQSDFSEPEPVSDHMPSVQTKEVTNASESEIGESPAELAAKSFEPPNENTLHGLIIDAMTFSKRPSMNPEDILEAIFSCQPVYRDQDRSRWRQIVLDALRRGRWYDRIARGGKDSVGHDLPDEYHYNPDNDQDPERAQLYPELARPMREASKRGLEKGIDWRRPKYRRW